MTSVFGPRKLAYLLGGSALLVTLGAAAGPDQQTGQGVVGDGPANVSPGGGTSLVEANSAAEVTLSIEELRTEGLAAVAHIEASAKSVRTMAAAAKDKRDVVKVLCLDDKTIQVAAALTTAQERAEALQAAIDTSALERARHEYVMLMTLKERTDTLMNEANQCIGEDTGFSGDAELSVQIDPNLPEVQADVVGFVAIVAIPPSLSSAVY